MVFRRHLPAVLAGVAAAVCAAGWFLDANAGAEHGFSSCVRSGGGLTLTFGHGAGQEFTVARKSHGNGDMTVTLRLFEKKGAGIAMLILSTITLDDLGGRLLDHDGNEIACKDADEAPGERAGN